MTSSFRVPPADLGGPYGKAVAGFARRTFGKVPDNLLVLWHHRPAMWAVFAFEKKVARFDALDANLKSLAVMASAAVVGCSWCLDFGYYLAHNERLDLDKIRDVPRWRESDRFTDLEREVLDYAEAITETPMQVTDEMVASLTEQLGVAAVVELTQMVAIENQRSRFNLAMGLSSQGFSEVCELPLAVGSTVAAPARAVEDAQA